MAFPQTALVAKAEFAFGADLSAAPGTWSWTDVTSRLRAEEMVSIRVGRSDESRSADPSTISCAFNNFDGYLTPRNPASPYALQRNTPFRFSVNYGSGLVERFAGFATTIKPKWSDQSARVATIEFEAAGILRRLGQGASPLKTPLYRAITSAGAVALWPLDDGKTATQAASGLTNGSPLTYEDSLTVKFGDVDGLVEGSYPEFMADEGFTGRLTGPIVMSSPTVWQLEAWVRLEGNITGNEMDMALFKVDGATSFTTVAFVFGADNGLGQQSARATFRRYDGSQFGTLSATSTSIKAFDGNWHYIRCIATVTATNVYRLDAYFDGALLNSQTGLTGTIGSPVSVEAPSSVFTNATATRASSASIAYIAATPANVDNYQAGLGYAGEAAGDRFERLCTEEGIDVTIDAGSTEAMGPQTKSTLVDLLRECESTDHGMMLEDGFGFRYIPREARHNATVAYDVSASGGELGEQPNPIEDDQGIKNDVTASRPNGSSARYENTDSIAENGRYDSKVDVNAPDDELLQHAQWVSHLGSPDAMRVPELVLNLAAPNAGTLRSDYASNGMGVRITVSNLPAAHFASNGLDMFVEGYNETFGVYDWTSTLNTSPARPYDIFTVEGDQLGRVQAGASALAAGVNSSATTLSVATSALPIWTTTATHSGDFPFDIEVIEAGCSSGERMTVTAITGTSSPQSFTVTRGVNGVQIAHASGATVRVWRSGQIRL